MLKVTNLTKIYATADGITTRALDNVNLEFGDKGLVCVLGPSGCGKTTLLNVIGGIDAADGGRVDFNDASVSEMSEKARNAYRSGSVGFVFQRGNLLAHLSVIENVALALSLAGLPKREQLSKAADALKRVGMYDSRDKKPEQLSGGQYQRVAIARAVAGEPSVILADEPTGSLDNTSGETVMSLLKELSANCLVITVTHNERLAERFASRVIRLSDGKVSADTCPEVPDARSSVSVSFEKPRRHKVKSVALACRNLTGNKLRSAVLSVASAISIIGLCIVFALLGGFAAFTVEIEQNMLSTMPISVGEGSYDITDLLASGETDVRIDKLDDEVYVRELLSSTYFRVVNTKEINEEYTDYIKNMDASLYNNIFYDYGVDMGAHIFTEAALNNVTLNVALNYVYTLAGEFSDVASTVLSSVSYFSELPDSRSLVESGYECVYGKYPEGADELVFIVDEDGSVDDYVMALLGYYSFNDVVGFLGGKNEGIKRLWKYGELTDKKYSFFNNDIVYTENLSGTFTVNTSFSRSVRPLEISDPVDGMELSVAGVLKRKAGSVYDGLAPGLYYTSALKDYCVGDSADSRIVQRMRQDSNKSEYVNPITGMPVMETNWKQLLRSYGGVSSVGGMRIFAGSVESKRAVLDYLAAWNETNPDYKVNYADNVSAILSYATDIIDKVAVLLIAVSVSALLVSAILLSVNTLLSVRNRTKEIGILRCIGAARADILLMILAESCLIGLIGGALGVALSYAALAICSAFTGGIIFAGLLAAWQSVLCVVLCAAVTCVAGIAPAIKASHISPAVAAGTE